MTILLSATSFLTQGRSLQPEYIRFAVFNQNTAMPLRGLFSGFNPGVKAGAEWHYLQGRHVTLFQSADLAYFNHSRDGAECFFLTQLGIRPSAGVFFAELKVGPAYVLQHSRQALFDPVDGVYEKLSGWQNKLMLSGGVALGANSGRHSISVGWNSSLLYPHLKNESRILPRQAIELLYRIKINYAKK